MKRSTEETVKAAIADIDQQIMRLHAEKSRIYAEATVKCTTCEPEGEYYRSRWCRNPNCDHNGRMWK